MGDARPTRVGAMLQATAARSRSPARRRHHWQEGHRPVAAATSAHREAHQGPTPRLTPAPCRPSPGAHDLRPRSRRQPVTVNPEDGRSLLKPADPTMPGPHQGRLEGAPPAEWLVLGCSAVGRTAIRARRRPRTFRHPTPSARTDSMGSVDPTAPWHQRLPHFPGAAQPRVTERPKPPELLGATRPADPASPNTEPCRTTPHRHRAGAPLRTPRPVSGPPVR
jgi:hypothetical protein